MGLTQSDPDDTADLHSLPKLIMIQMFVVTLPIGLHVMANVVQGVVLGFGVSGEAEPSLLAPQFLSASEWLTGGAFGLEASLPGLVTVGILFAGSILLPRSGSEKTGGAA